MEAEGLTVIGELDFSILALFWRATLTVKLVMILLLVGSFWSWTVIFQKHFLFSLERHAMRRFKREFWSENSLDELYENLTSNPRTSPERVFVAAMREWRRSFRADGSVIEGSAQRVERVMNVVVIEENENLNTGLSFLATVGATAPFIGLFGTVWGIKNAFEQIAIAQNTNLAVVAPGIAEALLATGLGLLAAIPAVIFYNKLLNDSELIVSHLEGFVEEFLAILSREMEK